MPNEQDYQPGLKYGNILVENDIGDSAITGAKLVTTLGYFSVSAEPGPNTTEKSIFGTSGLSVACTITGIIVTALDNTAVNVSLNAGTASIGTVVLNGFDNASTAISGPDADLESVAVSAGTNVFIANSAAGATSAMINFEIG